MQAEEGKGPELRRGFWRALLRIHKGRPGLPGSGSITAGGEFVGGLAGIQLGWSVGPAHRIPLTDALPVAGFYCFGRLWPRVLKIAGLTGRAENIVTRLRDEFPDEERRIDQEPGDAVSTKASTHTP